MCLRVLVCLCTIFTVYAHICNVYTTINIRYICVLLYIILDLHIIYTVTVINAVYTARKKKKKINKNLSLIIIIIITTRGHRIYIIFLKPFFSRDRLKLRSTIFLPPTLPEARTLCAAQNTINVSRIRRKTHQ